MDVQMQKMHRSEKIIPRCLLVQRTKKVIGPRPLILRASLGVAKTKIEIFLFFPLCEVLTF